MQNREYSLRLQRVLTDFGADDAFEEGCRKVKEHYGIEIPVSSLRGITLEHGEAIKEEQETAIEGELPEGGVERLIAETDGSMLPVVSIKPREGAKSPKDGRKRRKLEWKEARLSLARNPDTVTPRYAATMGELEVARAQLVDCVIKAGGGRGTYLHCVGDGAPWIANTVRDKFESRATFLVDLYHVSEYLAKAAEVIGGKQKNEWFGQQKQRMKQNQVRDVLKELEPHCESCEVEEERRKRKKELKDEKECPVEVCKRYIENRINHFDYESAIRAELPIGSGEVESGHRSVIQQRLKLPGAWWLIENINKMLALRTNRANNEWDAYWLGRRQAAA